LKNAAWFFLEDGVDAAEPFLLHNVDVMSTIDLTRMAAFHKDRGALATMAVQERKTSRPLLFDEEGLLRGRADKMRIPTRAAKDAAWMGHPAESRDGMQALAFSGIHAISPRIFSELSEEGVFSIVDAYLRLAARGEKIVAFRADEYKWRDLGRPENVAEAAREIW
jgi:NDP-sugar pyrophosphorylase family protein